MVHHGASSKLKPNSRNVTTDGDGERSGGNELLVGGFLPTPLKKIRVRQLGS